jgi:toxin ParE1/3/4
VVKRLSPGKALFHPEAEAEYLEALAYYRLHAPGVVEAFETDMKDAVALIERHPEGAPVERGRVRCKLMRRFPHELYYAVEPDRLRVLAVAHQRRRPGYWIDRI